MLLLHQQLRLLKRSLNPLPTLTYPHSSTLERVSHYLHQPTDLTIFNDNGHFDRQWVHFIKLIYTYVSKILYK